MINKIKLTIIKKKKMINQKIIKNKKRNKNELYNNK